MPLITDIDKSKKTKPLFQKKSYRPWNDELLKNNNQIDITTNNDIDRDTVYITTHLTELNLRKELRNLFGAQKTIIKYLLEQIEENSNDRLITKCISMNEFTLTCKLPHNTIKGMLQKLKAKKLLYTYENKPGRGGYARYNFTQEVYSFFLKNLNNI